MADIQFAPNSEAEGQLDVRVLDNNSSPTNVVEAAQNFSVVVDWRYFNGGNPPFAGDWIFQVFADTIGPGTDLHVVGPVAQSSGAFVGSITLLVPANTFPDPTAPGESGVYELLVLMTHSLDDDIAGFEERVLRVA